MCGQRRPFAPSPLLFSQLAQLLDAGGNVACLLLVALTEHDFDRKPGNELSLGLVAPVAGRVQRLALEAGGLDGRIAGDHGVSALQDWRMRALILGERNSPGV